ncbi:hypothetical protein CDD81_8000 [Ophiocordyceps australis]|uniref:Receptor L-domain domain-containing protein n=1 Tax=Ophiocordyceps australis TaxID=1399860 RepID=A0A2C5Y283_9HYPO|nr:hypothetical protein CDD81_8000 [Ophiocordyceps australis]
MHSAALFSAFLAIGATLVSGATTCTEDIRVSEPTPKIDCDVVDASILVDENVSGSLSIEGPKQIKKDFIVSNATKLISISSSSINSIGGTLRLDNLQLLSSFKMQSLKSVDTLILINLPQLSSLTFGTSGVTKCRVIQIQDTFLTELNGLNIAFAEKIDIANNAKLTMINSEIVNITESLKVTNNGNNMQVNMSRLQFAGDVQFRQVKSFDAPVLTEVESIKFNDSPELLTVSAKNLSTISASLTFINNRKLGNLSFDALKTIKGDMTIQNNTALKSIEGFPELETVGNILLRGNFETVKLPSLKDVKGSVTVTSTSDISGFCKFFDDSKSRGDIRGKESCTSNNKNANEDGGNGGESNGDKDKADAAGIVSVNLALLGLAALACIAQML